MANTRITGTIVHKDIGMGFWGIEGDDGEQYLPLEMPAELQNEGLRVQVDIVRQDGASVMMWGTPVRLVSHSLLS